MTTTIDGTTYSDEQVLADFAPTDPLIHTAMLSLDEDNPENRDVPSAYMTIAWRAVALAIQEHGTDQDNFLTAATYIYGLLANPEIAVILGSLMGEPIPQTAAENADQ